MIDLFDLHDTWNLSPILSTWMPDTGTVHQTLLLKTAAGNYALRAYCYKADERWRISCEHALIAFVQAHGLPALAPIPLLNGETILERQGRFYALFPFAQGKQILRAQLTVYEVNSMGQFLAQLHQVLHDYPQERVPQRSFVVDHTATLAKIDEIIAVIRSRLRVEDEDRQILARLQQRRAWLTTTHAINSDDFSHLTQQVIHGDYQETNLFFEKGEVSAIIDWDQAYVASRAWEVVRTLHYAHNLEAVSSNTFLSGYRRVLPLTETELEVAAAAYGWRWEHNLWIYEELYLKGNQRIRAFLQPNEPYSPFVERWASLQRLLGQG